MSTPLLEVTLDTHRTWLRLDWEGREVLRGSLPPLPELASLEGLLNALTPFFPAPLCIVFVADGWGISPATVSSPGQWVANDAARARPPVRRDRARTTRGVTP